MKSHQKNANCFPSNTSISTKSSKEKQTILPAKSKLTEIDAAAVCNASFTIESTDKEHSIHQRHCTIPILISECRKILESNYSYEEGDEKEEDALHKLDDENENNYESEDEIEGSIIEDEEQSSSSLCIMNSNNENVDFHSLNTSNCKEGELDSLEEMTNTNQKTVEGLTDDLQINLTLNSRNSEVASKVDNADEINVSDSETSGEEGYSNDINITIAHNEGKDLISQTTKSSKKKSKNAAMCSICQFQSNDDKEVIQHIVDSHSKEAIADAVKLLSVRHDCDLCAIIFKRREALKAHLSGYHIKQFSCAKCTELFYTPYEAQYHTLSRCKNVCSTCRKWFKKKKQLRMHQRECSQTRGLFEEFQTLLEVNAPSLESDDDDEDEDDEINGCDVDDEILLKTNSKERIHEEMVINIYPSQSEKICTTNADTCQIICALCQFEFSTEKEALEHAKQSHVAQKPNRNTGPATCVYCNLPFDSMKLHLFKQHGLRRCDLCDIDYKNSTLFDWHCNNSHVKTFDCPNCGERFPTQSEMNIHKYECFQCPNCPSKFENYENFERHLQKHLNSDMKKGERICSIQQENKNKLASLKEVIKMKKESETSSEASLNQLPELTDGDGNIITPSVQSFQSKLSASVQKLKSLKNDKVEVVHESMAHKQQVPQSIPLKSSSTKAKENLQIRKTHDKTSMISSKDFASRVQNVDRNGNVQQNNRNKLYAIKEALKVKKGETSQSNNLILHQCVTANNPLQDIRQAVTPIESISHFGDTIGASIGDEQFFNELYCSICELSGFINENELKHHLSTVHAKALKGLSSANPQTIQYKVVIDTSGKESSSFKDVNPQGPSKLKPNKDESSANSVRRKGVNSPIYCQFIAANTQPSSEPRIPRKSITAIEKVACSSCDTLFSSIDDYRFHIEQLREIASRRICQRNCQVCDVSISSPTQLWVHEMRFHALYECDICLVAFQSDASYYEHMRHHGKHYSCQTCKALFTTPLSLWRHLQTNLGCEYIADIVDVPPTSKLNTQFPLQRIGRLFKCSFCRREFKSESKGYFHIVSQHKTCLMCESSFEGIAFTAKTRCSCCNASIMRLKELFQFYEKKKIVDSSDQS